MAGSKSAIKILNNTVHRVWTRWSHVQRGAAPLALTYCPFDSVSRDFSSSSCLHGGCRQEGSNGVLCSRQLQPQLGSRQAMQASWQPWVGTRNFSSEALPTHELLPMPALSPTMTIGNIAEWAKKEGDKVSAGDVLVSIETDKATMDLEAQEEGYLAKILVPSGAKEVPVGRTIAVLVENEEDVARFADFAAEEAPAEAPAAASPEGPAPAVSSGGAGVPVPPPEKIGPSAKRLLAESGIDWTGIQGSGPRGMLTKGDVLAAIAGGAPKAAAQTAPKAAPKAAAAAPAAAAPATATSGVPLVATGEFVDLPNSTIRRIIAQRLLESKLSIPHYYLRGDATLDATLALRKVLKEAQGISVSVNDFIIRAAALALRDLPGANSFWDEAAGEIRQNPSVDISIAVATDKGLLTPVVRGADGKSLAEISSEVKALAERARAGKLKPEEFTGGSFTISNLGMFGTKHFSAIINPPQACILAVGAGEKTVVWQDGPDGTGGGPAVATVMEVTLSADNRVYDGEVAAQFLEKFSGFLVDPQQMLL